MRNLFLAIAFSAVAAYGQPTTWESRGIGGGGALYCPSFNPANSSEINISCDMGEVFQTTNAGTSWTPHHFSKLRGGHESQMQYSSGLTRYCISVVNDQNTPMKSADKGVTWAPLTLPGGGEAYYLACDYKNPLILVASDYNKLYFSNNGGSSFSTAHTGTGLHIGGSYFSGDTIIVGSSAGLIASFNKGQNWSLLNITGLGTSNIKSFAAARSGSTLRCVVLTYTAGNIYPGYTPSDGYNAMGNAVYMVDNLGSSWQNIGTGINFASVYPIFVGMAENNIQTIYLAGGSSAGNPVVYKSANAGGLWLINFTTTGNNNIQTGWSGEQGDRQWSYGEAAWGFSVAKWNASVAAITDLGFVHTTVDGGANWIAKYVDPAYLNPKGAATPRFKTYKSNGLENSTAWQLFWVSKDTVLAGYSDINAIVSTDAGKTWKFINGLSDNSVYRFTRHANGKIYAATGTVHDMYQTTRIQDGILDGGSGGIYLSTDRGISFTLLKTLANPVVWVEVDPTDPERLYASSVDGFNGGIWYTKNLSQGTLATWTPTTTPPRTQGHPYNIRVLKNGDLVVSYSAHANATRTTFYNRSGVFHSTNKGVLWMDRSDAAMQYYTKDVVIDPHDTSQSTWYAGVFQGWANTPANQAGLYRTKDKGVSWTRIFNQGWAEGCTVDPKNPNKMYVCTESNGLYYSSNATQATPTWTLVQSYSFGHPTRIFFDPHTQKTWVCSFGNGMRADAAAAPAGTRNLANNSSAFYPNPVSSNLFFSGTGEIKIYSMQGKLIYTGTINSEGIDVSGWAPGLYVAHTLNERSIIVKE